LENKFLYLTIDLTALFFTVLFSFLPNNRFYKNWRHLFPALILTAFIFIVWDILFTKMGIWGFNPDYVVGLYFANLPIEEVLFFFCIPYACVFTYHSINILIEKEITKTSEDRLVTLLIVVLFISGIINLGKWYTATTFISMSLFLLFLRWFVRPTYLGKFLVAFLFILIPFFIINGILTGTGIKSPVVWYNDVENLSIRMGTIPIEDTFYGMLLILMNITIYEKLKTRRSIA
jgi:lycopene cyclase domain-containing protein